ncbi:Eukaryotic translation initiation factor 3 subunit E, partial [Cichlidogyrus casuarinus]
IYDNESVRQMTLDVLFNHTSMIDFAIEVYQKGDKNVQPPAAYFEQRTEAFKKLEEAKQTMEPIRAIVTSDSMKDLGKVEGKELFQTLQDKHNFTSEMLQSMFDASMTYYDSSFYSMAQEWLNIFRFFVTMDDKLYLHACWGILACEILSQNWDGAMSELEKLKIAIDYQSEDKPSSKAYLQQLQQRTWMLHWSLYVFFNHTQGKEKLIDWFLGNPNHMNAIQTMAPHLLRYLAVCVVVSQDKKKKQQIKDLLHLIQQESYSYKDPITEFLDSLYVKFDFDKAQAQLRICEKVLSNDFFLTGCYSEFLESARLLMFETFCRIHHSVGIDMLSERLNMSVEEAESWIVNLIRNARMDAKIDSEKGQIIMGTQTMSPYEQVVERTREKASATARLMMRLHKVN